VNQRRLLTFVIVGGGPTGVELAGALAEIARIRCRRTSAAFARIGADRVAGRRSDVLPAFPEKLRRASRQSLERLGVEVRTGSLVTGIDADGVTWKNRTPSSGCRAETVLWAAGVAASPLARIARRAARPRRRVTPAPTLALAEHPNVFVAGDICAFTQDGKPLPGVAQVAMQQGAHAAKNILRAIGGKPLESFRYRNYGNMATIGRGSAVADVGPVKASGFLAWLFWLFLHIFWLIGFRNRFVVLTEWAWAYLTFQRRVRLITGEKLWPAATPDAQPRQPRVLPPCR
jgi:NADH dehydrogenase